MDAPRHPSAAVVRCTLAAVYPSRPLASAPRISPSTVGFLFPSSSTAYLPGWLIFPPGNHPLAPFKRKVLYRSFSTLICAPNACYYTCRSAYQVLPMHRCSVAPLRSWRWRRHARLVLLFLYATFKGRLLAVLWISCALCGVRSLLCPCMFKKTVNMVLCSPGIGFA